MTPNNEKYPASCRDWGAVVDSGLPMCSSSAEVMTSKAVSVYGKIIHPHITIFGCI
jgi:hypothetical protein